METGLRDTQRSTYRGEVLTVGQEFVGLAQQAHDLLTGLPSTSRHDAHPSASHAGDQDSHQHWTEKLGSCQRDTLAWPTSNPGGPYTLDIVLEGFVHSTLDACETSDR